MNRRKFLQASAASLAAAPPAWRACNAYAGNPPAQVRGLHFFGPDEGWQRTTAAAFHSDLWELVRPTGGYDLWALPGLRWQKSVYSRFMELNRRSELLDYASRCDAFIALANPDDPASLEPALDHCAVAKRAGALTFLLAVDAFADPEHDDPDQPRIFDRRLNLRGRPQPDVVINFTTLEPYMEMLNVASMLGRHYELLHNVDFADIKSVFDGKPDVVKLEGWAFESGRGCRAANEVCRYIDRGSLLGRRVHGAFIAFVVDPNHAYLDECWAALDVIKAALHNEACTVVVAWVPGPREEIDFLGLTALIALGAERGSS